MSVGVCNRACSGLYEGFGDSDGFTFEQGGVAGQRDQRLWRMK